VIGSSEQQKLTTDDADELMESGTGQI